MLNKLHNSKQFFPCKALVSLHPGQCSAYISNGVFHPIVLLTLGSSKTVIVGICVKCELCCKCGYNKTGAVGNEVFNESNDNCHSVLLSKVNITFSQFVKRSNYLAKLRTKRWKWLASPVKLLTSVTFSVSGHSFNLGKCSLSALPRHNILQVCDAFLEQYTSAGFFNLSPAEPPLSAPVSIHSGVFQVDQAVFQP